MFHKHKWIIIENYKFENELVKFIGNGVKLDGYTARDLAQRGVISVLQCEKCGKIKHVKTILE